MLKLVTEQPKQLTQRLNRSFSRLGKDVNKIIGKNKRHEFLKEVVKYNPDTGIFTSAYKDEVHVKGKHDKAGQLFIVVNSRKYVANRLAWFLMTGKWSKRKIQHKNGNVADNRFDNLEEVRSIERKVPKIQLPEGVHYSASDKKWVGIVYRHKQHYHLGRYTSEKAARKAVTRFISQIDEELLKNKDSLKELQYITSRRIFGQQKVFDVYQKVFIDKVLSGWGAWSYQDNTERNTNIIAKIMQVPSYKISDSAVIDIVERLHGHGYRGDELFSKVASLIASLKHHKAELCTDVEAQRIDELLIKIFGRNSPIIRVAVNYYVYGHSISDIALYVEKITDYKLTHYQAKNRVQWCLGYLQEKFYLAYEYERN